MITNGGKAAGWYTILKAGHAHPCSGITSWNLKGQDAQSKRIADYCRRGYTASKLVGKKRKSAPFRSNRA